MENYSKIIYTLEIPHIISSIILEIPYPHPLLGFSLEESNGGQGCLECLFSLKRVLGNGIILGISVSWLLLEKITCTILFLFEFPKTAWHKSLNQLFSSSLFVAAKWMVLSCMTISMTWLYSFARTGFILTQLLRGITRFPFSCCQAFSLSWYSNRTLPCWLLPYNANHLDCHFCYKKFSNQINEGWNSRISCKELKQPLLLVSIHNFLPPTIHFGSNFCL